ncbi:MAG: hypothetical protein EOP83_01900 [Verrucomicrobiaceae bacterium]|nr:MAG: hypothetical protein EOP83_01900 [Verrucomicrobiaceae bacterium]
MSEMRFHLQERPGALFPYRVTPKFFTSRVFTREAVGKMLSEQSAWNNDFPNVIQWCERNLRSNHATPWWVVHESHRRIFMIDPKDAMAFKMRWC